MKQITMKRTLVFLLAVTCSMALADEEKTPRRYEDGPLTAEDFQAEAPNPLPKAGRFSQLAFADTDILFRHEYRYKTTFEGAEATLKDIDIYAVFLSDKSWLSRANEKTLDHEQGWQV